MKFCLSWLKEHLDTTANIDEIAEQMHTTVDAVKAYKKRAKEQLRKKMGTLYGSSFTAMLLLDVFLEKL